MTWLQRQDRSERCATGWITRLHLKQYGELDFVLARFLYIQLSFASGIEIGQEGLVTYLERWINVVCPEEGWEIKRVQQTQPEPWWLELTTEDARKHRQERSRQANMDLADRMREPTYM
jgi:hypothetical protein